MTALMRIAREIGDLDDEFYADERQRDVWNEASAVGFQFVQWVALAVGTTLPWLAGPTGARVAIGVLAVWFVASLVVMTYARARDVDVNVVSKTLRPRVMLAMALYLAGVAGIWLQLAGPVGEETETVAGAVVGGAVGGGVAIALIAWNRRRVRRREAMEDALDL